MTVRVGIIGAGGIARERHLPGLRAIDGVEIVAVCNRARATAEAVAAEFGIPRVVTDWHDVIIMPEVDAVVIAAPPYLHCTATCAALEAGKHVLCQARMAMNVAEARAMLAQARASSDRVTMLVPAPMALVAEPYIQYLLADGYLGRPYFVGVRALGAAYADPAAPLHWRQMPEISGVNTLTVGIYNEIIQRWLGDTTRVMADAATSVPQRIDPRSGVLRAVEIPDTLSVVAQMANGAQAVYQFSGVARHAPGNRIEMYGSDGALIWDVDAEQLLGARAGDAALQPLSVPDAWRGEWRVEADFIAGIREGKPVWPTFEDGVKYMIFTEAVLQSATTGRAITLESI